MTDLSRVNRICNISKLLKPASALVLIAFILLLSVAGSSTALHKLIHADADDANHNCVVTLFTKGQISSAPLAPVVDSFFRLVGENHLVEATVVHPVSDIQLSPGRAPPVC